MCRAEHTLVQPMQGQVYDRRLCKNPTLKLTCCSVWLRLPCTLWPYLAGKVAAYACDPGLARTGHTATAVGTKVVILGGHGSGHPAAMDVLIVHLDTLRITR